MLHKYGVNGVDCIHLAHDRAQWRTLVIVGINVRVL